MAKLRNILAVIAGVVVGVVNMLSIPHPVWFWIDGVAVFLPAAYVGTRLAIGRDQRRRQPPAEA